MDAGRKIADEMGIVKILELKLEPWSYANCPYTRILRST
jgi:hypothetical protein